MRRARVSRLLVFCVLAGLIGLVGTLVLRSPQTWDHACDLARERLPALLGAQVDIERCELGGNGASLQLSGLSIRPHGAERPVFSADEATVRLAGVQPFAGKLQVAEVAVERPRLFVDLSKRRSEPLGCPLDLFERVELKHLRLSGAEVTLALPAGGRVELGGIDLDWRGERRDGHLDLIGRSGVVALGGEARPLALGGLAVEAIFVPEAGLFELQSAELALEDVTLSASGVIEQLCDPTLTLDAQLFAPLPTLAAGLAAQQRTEGTLWAHVAVSGAASNPLVVAEVVGSELAYGDVSLGDLRGRLSLKGDTLSLERLEIPMDGGAELVARATLGLRANLPLSAVVSLNGKASTEELARRLGGVRAPLRGGVGGRLRIGGELTPTPRLSGHVELTTATLEAGLIRPDIGSSIVLPPGDVSGDFRIDERGLEVPSLAIRLGSSRVEGLLAVSSGREPGAVPEVRFDGEVIAFDLGELERLGRLNVGGRGNGTVKVRGPLKDPVIEAELAMRDLELWRVGLGVAQGRLHYHRRKVTFPSISGQKGRSPYFASAEVRLIPGAPESVITMEMADGRARDLADLIEGVHPTVSLIQGGLLRGDASAKVALVGKGRDLEGSIDVDLAGLTYRGRRLGVGAVRLTLDGRYIDLSQLRLDGPLGRVRMSGRFDREGPLDYRFEATGVALPELVGLEQATRAGLEGQLAMRGTVRGDRTTPVMSGYVTAPEVRFAGRSLGAMHIEARSEGRQLQLFGRPFRDARMALSTELRAPIPYEGSILLSLPEIQPLLPDGAIAQGLSGSLTGTVNVRGSLKEPKSTRLAATLAALELSRGDLSFSNAGEWSVAFADGRWSIEPLTLVGPNTELSAAGWVDADRLELTLEGELDARLLESFVPRIERSLGRVSLTASASGLRSAPTLIGGAELQGIRLGVRDQPLSLRSLDGSIEFSDRRILVQGLRGDLNGGRIALDGSLTLERLSLDQVEMRAEVSDVTYPAWEDIPFAASGEVFLSGPPDRLVLSGEVEIDRLRYLRPIVLESLLADLSQASARVERSLGTLRAREWLLFDVGVSLGDVRVENNVARASVGGQLRLLGTNTRPGLVGTVAIEEGGQAFFRGTPFDIRRGLVEFADRKSLDWSLDVQAETTVQDPQLQEYVVSVHAFGRRGDPRVVLGAEPLLSEADILSLLTFGVTSRDRNATDGVSSGAGLVAEALLSATGLDRTVGKVLPDNPVLRDLSFNIATTYNEASGVVEPAAQLESKFLTDKLKLGLTRPVSGRGTRARAEYRFENGLSAQAQWDDTIDQGGIANAPFGNIGVALKMRWESPD